MDYILLTNYAFVVCGAVEEGVQSNNVFSEISLWQWLCVCVSAKFCVMCVVQSNNIFSPLALGQCLCVLVLCFA